MLFPALLPPTAKKATEPLDQVLFGQFPLTSVTEDR
jgi:hypothetical protein